MNYGSMVVWVGIGIIVVVSVVSGPLVPSVRVTDEPSAPPFFSNESDHLSATVVQPPPDPLRFKRINGDYAPINSTIAVRITNLTGTPPIVYQLKIPELNYTYLHPQATNQSLIGERLPISISGARVDVADVNASTYLGRIELVVRMGRSKRTLYKTNVTVAFGE